MMSRKNLHVAPRHRGDEAHLLREIVRTHQTLMVAFSRLLGIPALRLALLRILAVSDEDLGVMDLARRLEINPAAVSRQVQALEESGVVRRCADAQDARRVRVLLTSKGRAWFEKLHDRNHEFERRLAAVVGADELRAAAVVLSRVREFVEDKYK